jgi:hypothetical protein
MAAAASSSMNPSTTKALSEASTDRHQATGTPDGTGAYSTRRFGTA